MKKGKKIWNRLLSLVLCLVMVTGMFAGMGMEAKASISLYPKDFTVTAVDYGGNPIDTDCAHIEVTGYFYYAGVDVTIDGDACTGGTYRTIHYDLSNSPLKITGVAKGSTGIMIPLTYTFNCYHREHPDSNPGYAEKFAEYDVPSGTNTFSRSTTITLSRKNVILTVNLTDAQGNPVTSGVTVTIRNGQSDSTYPYEFSGLKEGNDYHIDVTGNGYNGYQRYSVEKNGQKYRSTAINIGDRKFEVKANVALEGDAVKWYSDVCNVYAGTEELIRDYNTDGYYFRKTLLAGKYNLTASGIAGIIVDSQEVDISNGDASVELKAKLKTPEIAGGTTVKCGETLEFGVKESVEYWDANYTWSSSNESVATVDDNGVVTAKSVGTTDITVTCSYGNQSVTSTPVSITVEKGEAEYPEGATFVGDDVVDETTVTLKAPENSALNPGDKAVVTVTGDCIKSSSYTTSPLVISADKTVVVDLSEQLNEQFLRGNVSFAVRYSSDNYDYIPPEIVDEVGSRAYYITKPLDVSLYEGTIENPTLSYGNGPLTIKAKDGFDSVTSSFTYSVEGATDVLDGIPTGSTGVASATDSTIASGVAIINASPVDGTKTTIKVTRAQDDTNFWAEGEGRIEVTVGKREINPLTAVTYTNEDPTRDYNGSNEIAAVGEISVADEGKVKEADDVSVQATLILPSKDADTYTSGTDSITIQSYRLTGSDAARNFKLPETIPMGVITTSGTKLTILPKELTFNVSNGGEFALNYQDLDSTSYETLTALNEKSDSTDLAVTVSGLVNTETYGSDEGAAVKIIDKIVKLDTLLDVGTHEDEICVTKETANESVTVNSRGEKNYVFKADATTDLIIKAETIVGALDDNVVYSGKNIWIDAKENEDDILWVQHDYGVLNIDFTEKYIGRYDSVVTETAPYTNLNKDGIASEKLQNASSLNVRFAVGDENQEDGYKNESEPYAVTYKMDSAAPVVSPYKFVENQTITSRIADAFGFDIFAKSVYTAEFTVTDEDGNGATGAGFENDDVEVYVYKIEASDVDESTDLISKETVKEKIASATWSKATHIEGNKYSVQVAEAASGQTDIIEGSYLVLTRVSDRVNNIAVYSSNGIVVEETLPQIKVTFNPEKEYYNSDVNYVIDVEDLGYDKLKASGLKEVSWTVFADGQEITELAGKTLEELFDCADNDGEYTLAELMQTYTSEEFKILAEKCNSNNVVLKVTAIDKSGNVAVEESTIVIDITDPVIDVKYDLNNPQNTNYFNKTRTATVTYTERNFDKSLATFDITVDGKKYTGVTLDEINKKVPGVTAKWVSDSQQDREEKDYTDERKIVAKVVFSGEYTYSFVPYCEDKATNVNDGITYAKNTAKGTEVTFTIDKSKPSFEVLNVDLDGLNIGSASPIVKIYDEYLDSASVRLLDKNWKDVTEKYLDTEESSRSTWIFKEVGLDESGTYTIIITAKDKAGNTIYWTEDFRVYHVRDDAAIPTTPGNGGVATGDSANIFLWGAVLAVGATGMVVAKKRRKDEEA